MGLTVAAVANRDSGLETAGTATVCAMSRPTIAALFSRPVGSRTGPPPSATPPTRSPPARATLASPSLGPRFPPSVTVDHGCTA